MSTIDWSALAEKAASQTDIKFHTQLANLTRLKTADITTFINESNITNLDAVKVLKEINDTTTSNIQKSTEISNIKNGVGFLIRLVSKVV